jgi:hypothetical protein
VILLGCVSVTTSVAHKVIGPCAFIGTCPLVVAGTDGNYVSARWPGDAYLFARRFGALLNATARRSSPGAGNDFSGT